MRFFVVDRAPYHSYNKFNRQRCQSDPLMARARPPLDKTMLFSPLLHGAAGLLDELLLFGAPRIVVLIILVINSRRARQQRPPRERERTRPSDKP